MPMLTLSRMGRPDGFDFFLLFSPAIFGNFNSQNARRMQGCIFDDDNDDACTFFFTNVTAGEINLMILHDIR